MKTNTPFSFKLTSVALNTSCIIAVLILFAACRGPKFFKRQHVDLVNDTRRSIGQYPKDSISVHYIGCAGFFIQKGKNTILIDPFFSYKVGYRFRLISETHIPKYLRAEIDHVFRHSIGAEHDDSGLIKALLIGHAHVDHFGDVPYLFENHHLRKDTKVIGSTTAGHYIRGNGVHADSIISGIEDSASSWLSAGKWVFINKNIRVLPITSEHAPHARILGININLASGKHESEDTKHCSPLRYGTGQTLSYLIDFLNDDSSINFRIYHSSAAANSPYGFPPASVLAGHRVDLEILCAASFNQVKNYPEEIVRYINPRHIVLSHWEDFMFSRITRIKKHPYTNAFYSYPNFFKRFNQLLHDINGTSEMENKGKYTLPNVDSKMTFYY